MSPLITNFGTLAAHSSVTIPVVYQAPGPALSRPGRASKTQGETLLASGGSSGGGTVGRRFAHDPPTAYKCNGPAEDHRN